MSTKMPDFWNSPKTLLRKFYDGERRLARLRAAVYIVSAAILVFVELAACAFAQTSPRDICQARALNAYLRCTRTCGGRNKACESRCYAAYASDRGRCG